jgi:acid stress-induced BolA-like protein IbaG/YrbA
MSVGQFQLQTAIYTALMYRLSLPLFHAVSMMRL